MGFRDLKDRNKACLLKLVWKLINSNSTQWIEVIKGKYERNCNWFVEVQIRGLDSCLWKNLRKLWHYIWEGHSWNIKDGKKVSFWKDVWVDCSKLIDIIIDTIPSDNLDYKVYECIDKTSNQNLTRFE